MTLTIKNHEVVLAENRKSGLKAFYDELDETSDRAPFDAIFFDSKIPKQHDDAAEEILKIRPDQKIISSDYLDGSLPDIANRINHVIELIKKSNSLEGLANRLDDNTIYDLLEKLNIELITPKKTELEDHPNNSKSELVEKAITKVLHKVGKPVLLKVTGNLYKAYNCNLSDCYEHPEYLKKVLEDLYGDSHFVIVESIRKELEEYIADAPISRFLEIITRTN